MLQQTQVDTVKGYFARWMTRFPSLQALASADEQDVLTLWEGLGYYSRARNLWRAARQVQAGGGRMPHTVSELERLPGVGRYTAAAIASMAFGQDEAALDGNIRRVLARVFNVALPARSPEGERLLWSLAQQHLPSGRAGDYNQALMDLGSLICTFRAPDCGACPLRDICQAAALGLQAQRPVMAARPPVPQWTVTAAVISRDGQVLIARRPANGLLGGLWEFPGGKLESGETLSDGLRREITEELGVDIIVGDALGVYRHAYTHFKVILHAFRCFLVSGEPQPRVASQLCWTQPAQLPDFPMGKIDRQIANHLLTGE
jgi:A/G-specific adenine glycosylase